MAKSNGNGNGRGDYPVGKYKPPREYQFKRGGPSPNPRGRPKGTRNLGTDVRRTLGARTQVNAGGRILATSAQEAALIVLREKALAGDARSLDRLLDEARRLMSPRRPRRAPCSRKTGRSSKRS